MGEGSAADAANHGVDMPQSLSPSAPLTERDVVTYLQDIESIWDELLPTEQYRIFHALVERVVVLPGSIDLTLRADGLMSLAAEMR